MKKEFINGKLYLHRTEDERAPLLQRLAKVEGQLRGVRQMVENDRYCGDELNQMLAILAGTREVMRLLVAQHVSAGIEFALDGAAPQPDVMADLDMILASLIRDQ